MRYWPLSVVLNSPLMPPTAAVEVQHVFTRLLSPYAYQACIETALNLPPTQSGLVIIESTDAPARMAYVKKPTAEEFERLERAGVIQSIHGFAYVIMQGLN